MGFIISVVHKRNQRHREVKKHTQVHIVYGRGRIQTSEKAMAPHSSTLAWKIPRMEESGRLQSMGSLRVRHD